MTGTATIASLLRARLDDDHPGFVTAERTWSWADVALTSAGYAEALRSRLDPSRPMHLGVLMENVPEYLFIVGGAALIGATVVGINPTRRGSELQRDIEHTDCQLVVVAEPYAELLAELELTASVVAASALAASVTSGSRAEFVIDANADAEQHPEAGAIALFLLFTSGSTSAPKAVRCSTERAAMAGARTAQAYGITREDVCYCVMPLFHGNALLACWAPALAVGATVVFPTKHRFSASSWLDDIRRFDVTYHTYVGRTIAYVLGQPPRDDDRDHRLRLGFGTEASALDRERFAQRFGGRLVEGYGSSESVVVINRTADTPAAALGLPRPDMAQSVIIVDPATGLESPRAQFDEFGSITNPACVGEIVNTSVGRSFEGYYNNAQADADRVRNGWYWTGDLGYRDEAGYFYFAGRTPDWLRVDSENFAAAPVESIVARFPGVVMVAVYPVPDPRTGDMVMAALELGPGVEFDGEAFDRFLRAQRDLGTKWAPQIIRIVADIPLTANNKINKQPLRDTAWRTSDPVWWRRDRGGPLRRLTDADLPALERDPSRGA